MGHFLISPFLFSGNCLGVFVWAMTSGAGSTALWEEKSCLKEESAAVLLAVALGTDV